MGEEGSQNPLLQECCDMPKTPSVEINLQVEIVNNEGEVLRVVKLEDPRVSYCKAFNENCKGGMSARFPPQPENHLQSR
jgi:hypothetical protein